MRPPIVKLALLAAWLVEPVDVAPVPFTVSAPDDGAVVSLVKVSEVEAVFPAASLAVTVYALGLAGLATQLNLLDV